MRLDLLDHGVCRLARRMRTQELLQNRSARSRFAAAAVPEVLATRRALELVPG